MDEVHPRVRGPLEREVREDAVSGEHRIQVLPLDHAPAAGAQLRYFVHGRDGDLLALLGFGAAARALADRDRRIR